MAKITAPRRQKVSKAEITFPVFFTVWAQANNWTVPKLHYRICEFLADYENWEKGTGVLQVFRGAAKSTIVGLFIAWRLVQDPTTRFLILSADSKTATKIVADVISIVSRHPLAKHLRGKENTWRANTIFVSGATDARSPSVTSFGILSNITGSRADWVIFDDVEVPKNAATEALREQLRIKLAEPIHILVPGGKRLFVGTPHSFESIYPEVISDGASSLRIPLLDNVTGEFPYLVGDSAWPERFSNDEVADRQIKSHSRGNFLSQYQLIPYSPENTLLDPSNIFEYTGEIEITEANGIARCMLDNKQMMSVSAWWDPSMGQTGDDSIFAVVYSTADGHYYIHRTLKVTGQPQDQAQAIRKLCLELEIPHIKIETNGIGAFLPSIARKEFEGTNISVEGVHTKQNKAEKILEAYETRLYAGYLHAHRSVLQGPFMTQFRDFNPKTIGKTKDDYIDAPAAAILNEPIRIATAYTNSGNKYRWSGNSSTADYEMEGFSF